jgi:hypothetical protein
VDAKEYWPSKTIHFPDGELAVFDGYGKDYVFHYKADGALILAWGGDIGDPRDQLKHWGPHRGAFDDRDGTPRVVIGMSDQQEIRRFTPEGRFIDQMPFPWRQSTRHRALRPVHDHPASRRSMAEGQEIARIHLDSQFAVENDLQHR